jgi:sugar phosphate permease
MKMALRWKFRYTILAILSVSWIVSFMDRMMISVAAPYIATDFHLHPLAIGVVISAFFASYSISQIPGGLLADIFGVRRVATVALLWWSAFTAITGSVANLTQLLITRVLFGLGEGIYPACVFKAVAEWFPPKERATANGIRQSAGPLGSALSPLIVVGLMSLWGWRAAFYSLFLPGVLISVLVWLFVLDDPSQSKWMSTQELAEVTESRSAGPPKGQHMRGLLYVFAQPTILKYVFVIFTFDIAYWGFTTWLPTYLVKARGFSMDQMGVAASLPFFAGTVASILGGWVSDRYFREARKVPLVAAQLLSALLLYFTVSATSTTTLMIFETLAGVSLNFFFTAFWALPMNTVPKEVMGVASGFINMGGQVAAFLSPICVGYLVGAAGGDYDHSFELMIVCLVVSCVVVLTLPNGLHCHRESPL